VHFSLNILDPGLIFAGGETLLMHFISAKVRIDTMLNVVKLLLKHGSTLCAEDLAKNTAITRLLKLLNLKNVTVKKTDVLVKVGNLCIF
jgi:hypothetical protein